MSFNKRSGERFEFVCLEFAICVKLVVLRINVVYVYGVKRVVKKGSDSKRNEA